VTQKSAEKVMKIEPYNKEGNQMHRFFPLFSNSFPDVGTIVPKANNATQYHIIQNLHTYQVEGKGANSSATVKLILNS